MTTYSRKFLEQLYTTLYTIRLFETECIRLYRQGLISGYFHLMDQIANQAAKYKFMSGGRGCVPLVLRTQGGSGNGLGAQHSQSLEAWFYHVPGLKVVMPATPYDAKGLLKTAIRDDEPVVFIEHKLLYMTKGHVPEEEYCIPLGKADIKREGSDVTLIAWSGMVGRVLEAAEQLAAQGIDAEVIDLRSLVPLDKETVLSSVRKTEHVVIVQEAVRRGGVASDICSVIQDEAFDYLNGPIRILAGKKTIPHYYLYVDVSMAAAMHWRKATLQASATKISITDIIVYTAAHVLRAYPKLNAHVSEDKLIVHKHIHVGVAVSVDDGLLVPVVADADTLSLEQISAQVRNCARGARDGLLKTHAVGTFTISNLGMYGVDMLLPIINPPECAILGVGTVSERPCVTANGIASAPMMTLSLACDHRAVNGSYAAGFLQDVKQSLERFDP